MAGKKIELQMWADITKMGGVDAVIDRIENGDTFQSIATELGISRQMLGMTLNRTPGVRERIIVARRGRAERWAEETLDIADNVPEDPNAINKAKIRIDTRRWLAGVDDPDRFGVKTAQVNISIGGLHLDALRKVQSEIAITISEPADQTANEPIDAEAVDVTDE